MRSGLSHELSTNYGETADPVAKGIVAGMEALLLALACEGINLNSVAASKSLVTAVEAAANQVD